MGCTIFALIADVDRRVEEWRTRRGNGRDVDELVRD